MIKLKTVSRKGLILVGNVNIYINSKDITNKRINLIINKLLYLNQTISDLKNEKINILARLEQSYDIDDRTIYFNNLGIIISLIDFYNNQERFLTTKCIDYKFIMMITENDDLRNNCLSLWEKEVDIFFSNCTNFEFMANKDNDGVSEQIEGTFEEYLCESSKKLIKIN